MKKTRVFAVLLLLVLCSQWSYAGRLYARRAGTETPVYNLVLSKISSTVNIYGQLAVTHVDEEFYNDNGMTLEGFYVFQLPDGAKVDGLWLWENNIRRRFIVLKKEDAERIYDSIVNPTQPPRDPAILESLGNNRFQLKVFPIGPYSSRRIELQYFHLLPLSSAGVVQYRYPLNLSGYQTTPVERTDMHLYVHSFLGIESLTTSFDDRPLINAVQQIDNNSYQIDFSVEQMSYIEDYVLDYVPINIYGVFPTLAWNDPDDSAADPYFITWHAFQDSTIQSTKKDIVFVLDASGSMYGDRIETVSKAVSGLLQQLTASDYFRIVLFSTNAISFPDTDELIPATPSNIADAIQYIEQEYVYGGTTNYEAAFRKALSANFRDGAEKKMVFLTDGDPTAGVLSYSSLISVIEATDPAFVCIYPILFYTDTIELLYDIAAARGGKVTEVAEGDDLQTVIGRILFDLSVSGYNNVSVEYKQNKTYQVFPKSFAGVTTSTQFVTTGRFNGDGYETAEVSYDAQDGSPQYITKDVAFNTTLIDVPEVGAYWASKRIDELLEEIDRNGESPELIESVVNLSIKHSILTPYTAFLVLETNEEEPPDNTAVESLGTVATEFALGQNYPNPFSLQQSDITSIPFSLPNAEDVVIVVTDMLGRVVKILAEGYMSPGTYTVTWDGSSTNGVRVAPGAYFVRLTAGSVSIVKMLTVVQ